MSASSGLTIVELQHLIAELLCGVVGDDEAAWRQRIGPVEMLPIWDNVQSNWRITPEGTPDQLQAIYRAADVVRAEHPYVHA